MPTSTDITTRVLWTSENGKWTISRNGNLEVIRILEGQMSEGKTDEFLTIVTDADYEVRNLSNAVPQYVKDKAQELSEREAACDKLRELFPIGSTVRTLIPDIASSSSGVNATVRVIKNDNDISWLVAKAIGMEPDRKRGGIRMGGYGYSKTFHIVYALGRALYDGQFYCTGKDGYNEGRCPSNDHVNGDREYNTNKLHSDGGYALGHLDL